MFYDIAEIYVRAGRGGDGIVSWRREAMVPRGGPDGGNGGRGGNVVLVVNRHLNTLQRFQYRNRFVAANGVNGGGQRKTGRSAKPTYVEVPPGTVVRDAVTRDVLADLTTDGQMFVAAKGGRGGRGNAMFATATNQAPNMAENGTPGDERDLALELKLIADIGFVGMPNAGKSTLLAALTAAKPKIGNYPFTTLQPNLGVADVSGDGMRTVVLADIPGLIEGASQGRGLGTEFLRHIERTRVLIHLVDGLSDDPARDFRTINAELAAFGHGLAGKPQIVAMNKMDLPDAQAAFELFVEQAGRDGDDDEQPFTAASAPPGDKLPFGTLPVSAATTRNARALLNRAVQVLDILPPLPAEPALPVIGLDHDGDSSFEIERTESGELRVVSPMLERKAAITRWDLDESVQRFQRALERSGAQAALEARGAKPGDTVYVGDVELEWGE